MNPIVVAKKFDDTKCVRVVVSQPKTYLTWVQQKKPAPVLSEPCE
jgi:hypothetical protein